tara:strand:- start:5588 stop:5785 length:198 start_codon:yes stop_codon:yes gene_type:complete
MGNMSYCRFYNTSKDVEDCIDAIENGDMVDLSQDEYDALMNLLYCAEKIVEMKEEIEDGARVTEY